jgi:CheY-like chemotaxis protein
MTDVLLVEDDDDLREALRARLERRGFSVVAVSHGREALDYLFECGEPIGIILLDLMMPVMDGWTLRQELLSDPELARIPVVVLSGVSDLASATTGLNATAWLSKPIQFDRLCRLVQDALEA